MEREENDGDESAEDTDNATRTTQRAVSSLPPSSPPRSPTGTKSSNSAITPYLTDDDDFDVDAAIRADEEQRRSAVASAAASSPVSQPVPVTSNAPKAHVVDFDEDAAMWDEFDDSAFRAALSGDGNAVPTASTGPATSSGPAPMDEDGDEDMWDVVRELENERARASKQNQSAPRGNETSSQAQHALPTNESVLPTGAPTTGAPVLEIVIPAQAKEKRRATNDEGWDEMYL